MHVNAGDTAWMLTSTALVFFMTSSMEGWWARRT